MFPDAASRFVGVSQADRNAGQDRPVKELAPAGITAVEAANTFIRDVYIPAHKTRFAMKAQQAGSAFMTIAGVEDAARRDAVARWACPSLAGKP
jgi:hypothetical protein